MTIKNDYLDTEMNPRRDFIKKTSVLGTGLMLAGASSLFAKDQLQFAPVNIKSKGYAAKDESGKLSL